MRFGWIVLLLLSFPVLEAIGIFWMADAIGGWVLLWLLLDVVAGGIEIGVKHTTTSLRPAANSREARCNALSELAHAASTTQLVPCKSSRLAIRPATTCRRSSRTRVLADPPVRFRDFQEARLA